MKTAAEIRSHIEEHIQRIYARPRMHASSLHGVDELLWQFHGLLAFVVEVGDFEKEYREYKKKSAVPGGLHYADYLSQTFPTESTDDLIQRLVAFWRAFDSQWQPNRQ